MPELLALIHSIDFWVTHAANKVSLALIRWQPQSVYYSGGLIVKRWPLHSSEPSDAQTETSEREGGSSETGDVHGQKNDSAVDQPELTAESEKSESFEQDTGESSSSGGGISDGEVLPSDKLVAPSSSSSPELSTEGDADSSNSTDTAIEPGEHD